MRHGTSDEKHIHMYRIYSIHFTTAFCSAILSEILNPFTSRSSLPTNQIRPCSYHSCYKILVITNSSKGSSPGFLKTLLDCIRSPILLEMQHKDPQVSFFHSTVPPMNLQPGVPIYLQPETGAGSLLYIQCKRAYSVMHMLRCHLLHACERRKRNLYITQYICMMTVFRDM